MNDVHVPSNWALYDFEKQCLWSACSCGDTFDIPSQWARFFPGISLLKALNMAHIAHLLRIGH